MKSIKILLTLEEGDCTLDLHETTTPIFKHLVNMGLGERHLF